MPAAPASSAKKPRHSYRHRTVEPEPLHFFFGGDVDCPAANADDPHVRMVFCPFGKGPVAAFRAPRHLEYP